LHARNDDKSSTSGYDGDPGVEERDLCADADEPAAVAVVLVVMMAILVLKNVIYVLMQMSLQRWPSTNERRKFAETISQDTAARLCC